MMTEGRKGDIEVREPLDLHGALVQKTCVLIP